MSSGFDQTMDTGIVENLQVPTRNTKLISVASITAIIVAFYFLGYLYSSRENPNPFEFDVDRVTQRNYKDYSVSNAIGNGAKPAINALIIFMTMLTVLLIYIRKGFYYKSRMVLFGILGILLVLIVYINPLIQWLSNKTENDFTTPHFSLAGVAFVLNAIFIGLTCHTFKKEYQPFEKWYKSPIYLLVVLDILFLIFCLSSIAAEDDEDKKGRWGAAGELSNAFAVFENLQLISVIVTILLLGFYKNTVPFVKLD